MKHLLRSGLLAFCFTAAASAATVWNFTGICSDCPDFGYGTLTATEIPGEVLFSFTYSSDWLSYTMDPLQMWGNTGGGWSTFTGTTFAITSGMSLQMRGFADVTSFGGSGNPLPPGTTNEYMYFAAGSDGSWSTGVYQNSDFGTGGAWTQGVSGVPEPSTLALGGLGAVALLLLHRRRLVA